MKTATVASMVSERYRPGADDYERALRRAWFPVAHSADLTSPVSTRLLGVHLVVFRDEGGRARVMSNRCPHRGASLAMGTVVGDAIQCPYHGWQWEGSSGRCALIPALGRDGPIPPAARVTTYDAREKYGIVWATLSENPIGQVPQFEEFDGIEFAGAFFSGPTWDVSVNACAAIENFRDVAHLPFVHEKTIGALPHEVEPLNARRDGFHAYLEHTSEAPWAARATTSREVVVKYHAIAPSAVAILMTNSEVGQRAIVFTAAPTALDQSRWYTTSAVTPGFPVPVDDLKALSRAITDEDVAIMERVTPRAFEGMFDQVHCLADAYTLKYRDAFTEFVQVAASAE